MIEYVSFVPFPVKLFLNQLHNLFLLGFDPRLLFSKPIQFRLFFSYFLAIGIHISKSRIWIFVPYIQNRDKNVLTQVIVGLLTIKWYFTLIILTLFIIETMGCVFEDLIQFTLLILFILHKLS